MIQAEADGAIAEEGVVLLREQMRLRRDRLVAAEVEGADRDRRGRQRLGEAAIGGVLLLLRRHVGRGEVEKLGAEQADAVRRVILHQVRLLDFLDVGAQRQLKPVQGHRGQTVRVEKLLLQRALPPLDLPVAKERALGRVENHQALVAVDEDVVARLHLRGEIAQPDHGGDLHRARHDDGVARLAARISHHPQRRRTVQPGRVRRRNVVRHHNAFVGELREPLRSAAANF